MTLGVFVKASNTIYFGRAIDFFFEFIPQLVFMILLFGYMDFLIIYKWLTFWPDASVAPSIITTMINMPLKLGKTVIVYVFRMIAVEDSQCGVSLGKLHKTQYSIGSLSLQLSVYL